MSDVKQDIKHIHDILRHIGHVQDNCLLLGERLIERGEFHLGRRLIANSMQHDYSKFFGFEFEALRKNNKDKTTLEAAVRQHNQTNMHHPEFWGSIHNMEDAFLAEMICDWKARAGEFGTSLSEWITQSATQRFGFTVDDPVFARIKRFLDLLLDEPFKQPIK